MAWNPLGWRAAFLSEVDAFPNAVLSVHHPDSPNWGDMTRFEEWPRAAIDVLVGGTPCQSFSVAGLRKGLDDPRGNLLHTYLAIARRYRPRWVVWENVPGVLSSGGGRDFGALLGGLAVLGYGFAYRVLDAQYFGVAQRRARVFVVGYLGNWQRAAAVLFERSSLQGDSAPRRETRESAAAFTPSSIEGYREGCRTLRAHGDDLGWGSETLISRTLNTGGRFDYETETFVAAPQGRGNRLDLDNETYIPEAEALAWKANASASQGMNPNVIAPSLDVGKAGGMCVAFAQNQRDEGREMAVAGAVASEPGMKQQTYVRQLMAVRRLTPLECERLQGFPDGYTNITYRGRAAADGPRYKALGNSMAVPVMRWIGERIAFVDKIEK